MADIDPCSATRIDLSEEPDFDFGEMRVQPAERSVSVRGVRRELQPRVMQVLVALAKAKGAVVSRDRLIEQCWDGRIVGDDALNRCVQSLRSLARQFTPEPFAIETMPRVGHRLVVPQDKRAGLAWLRTRWAYLAAALLLALTAGYFIWQQDKAAAEPASIAVLPFRNLSQGDPHFAEGIGEEILGQLSREPQFRVAGRATSREFGADPDPREVGRRLDVDYALQGSVRTQADRVRVSASLVRTRDGTQLWSNSYDGKLDDIFAIQQQIGTAIATALRRRLIRSAPLSGPLVTKGEAYNLYLTARALIRTRNRRVGPTAVNLLRDAIGIDPGYAPAWASLADATLMQGALGDRETFIAAVRKSRSYASRAIKLAPDLAEAHRAFGGTFGHGDPQALAHLSRAADLDPNNAENLIGLVDALSARGEFEQALATLRQAHGIDPLWYRTTGLRAITLAEMGDCADAESTARRDLPDKGANLQILLGRIAWTCADYSEAARRWAMVARSNSPRWAHVAERTFYDAAHAVGVRTGALVDVPEPPALRTNWRVWMDAPPAAAEWQRRNRDPVAAEVYRKHNLIAAKLMLNAGRWREIAATYDGPIGLFGLGPGRHVRVDQIHELPVLAIALRQSGRAAEADRLLREADVAIRAVYRRGGVPFWFEADAAALLAVQGRQDEALATLERAYKRGWRLNGSSDLRDIAGEPAFRSLHGAPRFERIQGLLAAHYARERNEMAVVLRS